VSWIVFGGGGWRWGVGISVWGVGFGLERRGVFLCWGLFVFSKGYCRWCLIASIVFPHFLSSLPPHCHPISLPFPSSFSLTSRHPPKHPTPPPPNPPVPPNSTIRQVPDNQEAYLSTTGLTSLLFDLAERVHPDPDTDAEALRFHLADVVAEGDECTVLESAEVRLGNFPYV